VQTGPLGYPRVHLRSTDSTNLRARELASAGVPHGTLVTAGEQTAGRGRQGRQWSAPAGSSLLMSVLLRPAPRLTPLIAAVAVCDALDRRGVRALVKWPNDIVLPQPSGVLAKLAGILVEGRPQEGWAVLGIGLNVAIDLEDLPAEVRPRAATLKGSTADIEPLLRELMTTLRTRLEQHSNAVLRAWSERDALRGQRIAWGTPTADTACPMHEGTAHGIDDDGLLVVKLIAGGQTSLEAGEIHLTVKADGAPS
jgi:BirA family transcriptional regulator, biotin operon repressor / biotin---[acetyl-CoA-carboxylase] ligase